MRHSSSVQIGAGCGSITRPSSVRAIISNPVHWVSPNREVLTADSQKSHIPARGEVGDEPGDEMGRRVAVATGAEVWTEIAGSGPPVVLVHGNFTSHRMWEPQIGPFAEHFTVIAYDVRGFGLSPLVPGRHCDEADLRALLEVLGIGRPHVVGLSMGADIALRLALAYPGVARSLVVVPGGIHGNVSPAWMESMWPQIEAAIVAGDGRRARDIIMDVVPMRPLRRQPGVERRMVELIDETRWSEWAEKWPMHDWLEPPTFGRLGELDLPILTISPELDAPEFQAESERIEHAAPQAKRVVIPDSGHMVNMEAPDEFNRVVLGFLERVERASGGR